MWVYIYIHICIQKNICIFIYIVSGCACQGVRECTHIYTCTHTHIHDEACLWWSGQNLRESMGELPLLVAGSALMIVLACVCAALLIQILPTPGLWRYNDHLETDWERRARLRLVLPDAVFRNEHLKVPVRFSSFLSASQWTLGCTVTISTLTFIEPSRLIVIHRTFTKYTCVSFTSSTQNDPRSAWSKSVHKNQRWVRQEQAQYRSLMSLITLWHSLFQDDRCIAIRPGVGKITHPLYLSNTQTFAHTHTHVLTHHDRSPFTGGGNRTHVAVPKEPSYDGSLIPLGYRSTYRIR